MLKVKVVGPTRMRGGPVSELKPKSIYLTYRSIWRCPQMGRHGRSTGQNIGFCRFGFSFRSASETCTWASVMRQETLTKLSSKFKVLWDRMIDDGLYSMVFGTESMYPILFYLIITTCFQQETHLSN